MTTPDSPQALGSATRSRRNLIAGICALAVVVGGVGAMLLMRGHSPAGSGDQAREQERDQGDEPARRAGGPMGIVVTIPPLEELARRLAPAGSSVRSLMTPGRSEHGYEFTPGDLAALAGADVVVYVGLGLEPQVEQFVTQNRSRSRRDVCFAIAAGVAPQAGADFKAAEHDEDHDDDGDHHHGVDPHLWLDPVQVRKLVPVLSGAIGASLRARGQDTAASAAALADAEETLLRDVDGIDAEYHRLLDPHKGGVIVTHHSAWGRLAGRYGLKVAAVIRPVESSEPTPGQIAAAVEAIRKQGAKTIFIEPQFDAQAARRIAEAAGVKVSTLDPLGTGDWFALMRANLKALAEGL